jgi:hypothetical protein
MKLNGYAVHRVREALTFIDERRYERGVNLQIHEKYR